MRKQASKRDRPSYYDGTQLVVIVDLPPRKLTTRDVHQHVYGVCLDDGAKPWPYYKDAESKEWWSLSTPGDAEVDSLAWMIDLSQLAYKSRNDARYFLETVLPKLTRRATQFGAVAEPECSVPAALDKMDRVSEMLKVRDYQVTIVVAAPWARPVHIAKWWQALESVGLSIGDGDLFWLYNDNTYEDHSEPSELFCAEPYSLPGYFHPGDIKGSVAFPDVALHFRARDFGQPVPLLHRMAKIAEQLAQALGATLLTSDGHPFRLDVAESELKEALIKLQKLRSAT